MRFLRLLPVVLLLAAACGGDDDGGGGGDGDALEADASSTGTDGASADAPASSFAVNLVERTCGPADGPAITLRLGGAYDPESCMIDPDAAANLVISIYLDEWNVEAPVTYTFDPEALTGSALACPAGDGACRSATAGEVHLDTFSDGESASGTYELTMPGGPMTGSFDATWCAGGGGPYCG
jgi:hypothetical protein